MLGALSPQLSSPSSRPSSTYQPETNHATSQGPLNPVSSRKGELSEILSWQSQVGFFSCSSGVNSLCGLGFIATKLPEEPAEKVAFHGLAKEDQLKDIQRYLAF